MLVSNLSDNGVGSLRQALCDADDFGNITIDIPPAGNAPAVPAVLTLTTGELVVNKHITISGPGANLLTIRRDPSAGPFRIFHINPYRRVTIEGLTISGGDIGASSGAGIFNDRSFLTVIGCAFLQNSVEYYGGAIFSNGTDAVSSLTIDRCTFSNNSAERGGGAVLL